jgi:hypothetical protein
MKGNGTFVFTMIGASNHSEAEREPNDYYATDPIAVEMLLGRETFAHDIWEPACGEGHISRTLSAHGYSVKCNDLIKRIPEVTALDFLKTDTPFDGDIITNPPYKLCSEFIVKALSLIPTGHKVAMLLKLVTLEGQKRYNEIYRDNPPKKVLIFVKRIECAKSGKFTGRSAICYAWFIWEKGFKGKPIIDWLI